MAWICEKCGFVWSFPVGICIKCNIHTKEYVPHTHIVKGITEVLSRSEEHNDVPYYVLLLEDDTGRRLLRKSFQKFEIGHEIIENTQKIDMPRIGIVGTGITAVGIAQAALMSGCKVFLKGRSEKSLNNALNKIEKALLKSVINAERLKTMISYINPTTKMSELSDVDIVIEAVTEDIDVKRMVFEELDLICDERTILASNTSSLSIDEISKATNHPERVIGMHFFNPILKMRLVEIVCGTNTAQSVVESIRKFAHVLNKTPVIVKNSPGFIVNRLLMIFLSEAVQILEENLATQEDIDRAIELGLNHPMGPLKLIDLIGIDVFYDITSILHDQMPNKFHISPIIKEMMRDKKLGRKTGEGFYEY